MIPIYKVHLEKLEKQYVSKCLSTGWISSAGKFVTEFEEAFAKYIGVKYAVATMNGTSALHLLILAAEVGLGDEVIIPDYTFISTALAVTYSGAKVVPVDVEKDTWNINPELAKKAITPKTKAIIPVDIYGLPADIKKIKRIAKKYNLLILQDSAEAFGSKINNKKVGSEVHGAIFSFYGNKTLTTGEGGMLVTNDKKIYEKAKMLKDYGRKPKEKYIHYMLGFNYRMTNIQAALGLAQLEKADKIIKRKVEIKNLYQKLLKDTRGISFQKEEKEIFNACWLVSLVIDPKTFGLSKDKLAEILNKNGIETRNFFYPIHLQPIFRKGSDPHQRFPVTDFLYKSGFSLPSYPDLTEKDIKYICKCIKEAPKNS